MQVSNGTNFGAVLKVSDTSSQSTGVLALGDGNSSSMSVGIWRGAANSMSSAGNYLNLGGYSGIVFSSSAASIGSQSERMRLDSSGNLGLGVTPSAWSGFTAIQVGSNISLWSSTAGGGTGYYSNNLYYNGSNRIFITSGYATEYQQQSNGNHAWFTAPNGTAGNAVYFTQAMTLTAGGDLALGLTSPQQRLHVHNSGTSYVHISNDTTGTGGSDGADIGFFSGQSSLQINNRENADMVFSTNNTERFRIASTGAATFSSSIQALALYLISSGETRYYNANQTNWGTIKGSTGTSFGTLSLTGGSGNGLFIDNSGNLGIGNTSPNAKLEILGTSSDQIRLSTAATEHYRIGRNAYSSNDCGNSQLLFFAIIYNGLPGSAIAA